MGKTHQSVNFFSEISLKFSDLVLPYGRVLYDYKTDSDEKHELLEGQPSAKKVLKASAMPMISPSYVGMSRILVEISKFFQDLLQSWLTENI